MKPKYSGLATVLIVLMSFTAVIGYGVYYSKNAKAGEKLSFSSPPPDVRIPENALTGKLAALFPLLPGLLSCPEQTAVLSAAMFGKRPVRETLAGSSAAPQARPLDTSGPENDTPDIFPYRLTLCFTSPKNSFCVIDGQLYGTRAELPDTGRILKIDHDRVLIRKNDINQWVSLVTEEAALPEKEDQ